MNYPMVTGAAAYPGRSNPVSTAFCERGKQFSRGGFGVQQGYIIDNP